MKKKYKERINYLMEKYKLLDKLQGQLGYDQRKLNREIDILKFTGTFDLNRVQVNIVTKPVVSVWGDSVVGSLYGDYIARPAIECKYVKDDKLESVHYILDDEKYENVDSNTEVKIKDNYKTFATLKIGKFCFRLDKRQNVIVEMTPITEVMKSIKEKKCTKK